MRVDVVLWVLGVAVTALMAALGFLVNWNRGQDARMGEIEKDAARLARHTAENYVRGHEIAEVKAAVAALRVEMTTAVAELRNELAHQVGELTKAVYQMMGQNNK